MKLVRDNETGVGGPQTMAKRASNKVHFVSCVFRLPVNISLVLLLLLAACGGHPPPSNNSIPSTPSPLSMPAISRPVSSADVVKALVPDTEITTAGAGEAKVLLDISQGYHVNANPATFPYLIATAVEAGQSKGITIGKPVYPAALMKTFSFEKQPLSVYEGAATIKLPLQCAGNAEKGARSIPLKVRVQACDDKACYAPATLDLTLHLAVK
jgi:cytochrome c biogenesis DsbD-like protein